MSAGMRQGAPANDDNPDFPAETWLNGAAGLAGSVANIATPQAFSNKSDRRTPYTLQYLFNVQRELANNLTFEAGYLGSVTRHLESYRGVSAAVPGLAPTPAGRPIRTSVCWFWLKTAAAPTTIRSAPS